MTCEVRATWAIATISSGIFCISTSRVRVEDFRPRNPCRNLPASGFRPTTWLAAMGVVVIYGFYKLGQGNREQKELAREKMWSRIHLIPLLQAEEDRDLVRRHIADQAREKQLVGENFKVYNSDRYVRPTYAVTPSNVTK
ncbi:NADH-ubiquinone oxidoreductase subunit [Xylariaceae sp. FL0662B]|nr:NADH-ubiquinone oxidoreductase subunit [Xylariaceae sp. FL0662B]